MNIINDDLLNANSGFICHGVNCCGKMGKGVALAVRQKYPKAYAHYMDLWKTSGGLDGDTNLLGIAQFVPVGDGLWVVNCHNQVFYGKHFVLQGCATGHFNYEAFDKCLQQVVLMAQVTKLPIHLPKIGCNLAGGEWNKVCEIIGKYDEIVSISYWAGKPL